MITRRRGVWTAASACSLTVAIAVGSWGASRSLAEDSRPAALDAELPSVERALQSVSATTTPLAFAMGETPTQLGGHLQGVQLCWDAAGQRWLALLSHDSETIAYLVIVEFPADLTGQGRLLKIHELPGDDRTPPLRHAGGMQVAGDVLAVGLEDNKLKTRAEIQFWNVANPLAPARLSHLTIRRAGAPKEQTAGAVGLARRAADHLLAVANWDSRAIDFYVSNGKPLDDPQCRFALHARWQVATAEWGNWQPDANCGAYQSVNLLSDASGATYLLGFHTSAANVDAVDLFAVDTRLEESRLLRKVSSKRMTLGGDSHFRYAGGVAVQANELWILAGPSQLQPTTSLSIAKPVR
jgi:hypothetical protein